VTGPSPPSRYRDGARAIAPIAVAAAAFAASFGILARAAGFDAVAAIVMSATTFAGAAQFAVASTLETGGTIAAAITAAVFLNARYVAISVTVASIFPGGRLRRFVESQLIVDESWALSGRSGRFEYAVLAGAGVVFYVLWVGGTTIGALAGEAIGDARSLGLDAAFPALFLALLVPYLRSRQALAAAVGAAAITFALIPFTPAGVPIVAASLAALVGLRR
jgi:predicted branched-subunit amino acid permease